MKKNTKFASHSRHSSSNAVTNLSQRTVSPSKSPSTPFTDRFQDIRTEGDLTDRHSPSPFTLTSHSTKRPISLSVLEKYFSDICQSINSKTNIELSLLSKVNTMKEVLQDCLNAISDLSLEIFILMNSALKDLQHLQQGNDKKILSVLLNKLIQITALIEENRFTSKTEPAVQGWTTVNEDGEDLATELEIRVSRVTARVLNIWKKIVTVQRESGIICCCFMLLYCEVDRTIKVSPFFRVKYDKAVNMMKDYSANPGYVVTVIRKTKEYIEKELISAEVIRRIYENMTKITTDSVKDMDKTFTGFVLYELILYSIHYYQQCYFTKYGISLFQKDLLDTRNKDTKVTEKSFSGLDSFHTTLSFESPQRSPIKPALHPKPSVKSLSSPFCKSLSQSSSKCLTTRSSLVAYKATPSPSKPTASKSPLRSMKSLFGHKSQVTKSVEKTKETKGKERIETSASTGPVKSVFGESLEHSQMLEEMQYQQFIEQKFRNFLIWKLEDKEEGRNEEKILRNRENWMKEFENKVGIIRFNAIRKLSDDKRFSSELDRAQRQLGIGDNYMRSK